MEIFQLIRIYFEQLGMGDRFNVKVVVSFLILAYEGIFACAFFLFKAETCSEFIESFYIFVTLAVYYSYFVTIISTKSTIFTFMTDFDDLVGKRELNLFKLNNNFQTSIQINHSVV